MKMLEAQGLSRNQIIDGRVFQIPNLDFPRFLKEGIAYGSFEKSPFKDQSCCIYTRIFSIGKTIVKFGVKSYSAGSSILGAGEISIGKYSPVASGTSFQLARNVDHNYGLIGSYALTWIDWQSPKNYLPPTGICKMEVGNDVWIGRGCIFKSINPKKPLVIGDGAVIASNSVVVKNVPPYAIVGGNPAQIIKYRFEPHIIDALLRIKWWDWTLDKIHDNFKYWNDIDKFIALHDR